MRTRPGGERLKASPQRLITPSPPSTPATAMNHRGEMRVRNISTQTSNDTISPGGVGVSGVENLEAHSEEDAQGDWTEPPLEGDPPGGIPQPVPTQAGHHHQQGGGQEDGQFRSVGAEQGPAGSLRPTRPHPQQSHQHRTRTGGRLGEGIEVGELGGGEPAELIDADLVVFAEQGVATPQ